MKRKIFRITTVPESLGGLLEGQLRFMANHYDVIGISSAAGQSLNKVGSKEQIRVLAVEMTRKITPFKDIMAFWKLYWIFRAEMPFLVHTHTPKAGTLGMFAAYFAKVPHRLHTVAGLPLLETTGKKRRLLNVVEKLTYRCATKIYPNSFGLMEKILENRFTTKNKLKVIGNGSSNGIDTDYFDPQLFDPDEKSTLRANLDIAEGDFVYIFIGRLVSAKGINELAKAFNSISLKKASVKLILVGKFEKDLDPLNSETEQIFSMNSSINNVGWQVDVRPYLAISNCLVFPSYREGFPNVVMQAGAMGLFSIVTDINGCNEIVSEGENGTLIPPKDVDSLILAMEKVISHRNAIYAKTDEYRDLIGARFEQKAIWKAILTEYKSLEPRKV